MEDCFKVPQLSSKLKSTKGISTVNNQIENKTQENQIPKPELPYVEPKWSKTPDFDIPYDFEVLKNGVIVDEIKNLQEKSFWVFGRLPESDIVMAHPTISRFHAVLQFRPEIVIESKLKSQDEEDSGDKEEDDDNEKNEVPGKKSGPESGWYLYDLNSTHGTFLNKNRIPSKTYVRVRVGHIINLGASTRKFILQGPNFDVEDESELTVTQLKEAKLKRIQESLEKLEQEKREKELLEKQREEEGISWGMGEDADEETDLTINPYASTNNEELFLDDPKKTLRGFFEREGLELEYKVDDMTLGTFVCRVELPVDDANGRPMVAEVCHKGKKKDAVVQCALEACRILDRQGVLRTSTHEPRRRKKPTDSDSDDDDFLDRTGHVERRRQRKLAQNSTSALSHQELLQQEKDLILKLTDIQNKIEKYQESIKESKKIEAIDDLDSYMDNLSHEKNIDKTEIRKLRFELQNLEQDHLKLKKLIKIAAPVELPPLIKANISDEKLVNPNKKFNFPLFGKRNKIQTVGPSQSKVQPKVVVAAVPVKSKEYKSDEEEIEEDDEKDEKIEMKIPEVKEEPEIFEKIDEVKIKGPTFDPNLIKETSIKLSPPPPPKSPKPEELKTEKPSQSSLKRELSEEEISAAPQSSENSLTAAQIKKSRRNRNRNRGGDKNRDNVDMNDDVEDTEDVEKYSGWVPPENQAGDGLTKLNEKFGY